MLSMQIWYTVPDSPLLQSLRTVINKTGDSVPGMGNGFGGIGNFDPTIPAYEQVVHSLLSLVAAAVGGLLTRVLFGRPAASPSSPDDSSDPATETLESRRSRRRRLAITGLSGVAVFSLITIVGMRSFPSVYASVVFLLTCGMLGLTIVGAVYGRKNRPSWFGAALFGVGYATLIFHYDAFRTYSPHVATDRLLHAVRTFFPWIVAEFPPSSHANAIANDRIRRVLDWPIPMYFPTKTPMENVIAYIQQRTNDNIPIYVEPVSLAKLAKLNDTAVLMELDGVPLRKTLRLVLKQNQMDYSIRDGILYIGSELDPVVKDAPSAHAAPFISVGQCFFTLIAAGVGSLVAPLVCGRPSRRNDS